MSQTPRVTVSIPTYGRAGVARLAVASAIAQDLPPDDYEVIVADSSPDDSVERMVLALQSEARCRLVYAHKAPEGPGPSRNLGARLGRGGVIAFLDSDCVATPGWLRAGLAAFEPGVGIVQGRTLADPRGTPGVLSWYLEVKQESFLFESANIFYRREAFEPAGGFWADRTPTSAKPTGGEDVDLGWRVRRAGWRTRFAPDALVYHEIVPIPVARWLYNKHLAVFPLLIRRFPELRDHFYARYFYDRHHALLALALAGALVAVAWTPWAALAALPYLASRFAEPTRTLGGIRRPIRVAAYLVRDAIAFGALVIASVRHRTVLL